MSQPEKIRVLLVDDEKPVRMALREIIQRNFDFVEIVGEAANIPEAVREVHTHKPDLLFLDIDMPGYTGLQILDFFNPQEVTFDIIFVTAYNEYALQAFKTSAFDYLLKPVNPEELKQTLQRYQSRQTNHKLAERVHLLKKSYDGEELTQLAISSVQGIEFIAMDTIVYLEASGTYTTIVMDDKSQVVSSKPIGEFEELLSKKSNFFRAHRSFIVNLNFVRKLSSKEGDIIIMSSGAEIPLSRYRKKDFDACIQGYRI
jgi:two-component system, LytTR family, response regulator